MQRHQVRFLTHIELRLLAAKTALGLGYPHPFPGAHADQVALELRHHGQHVEQQPAHRVGGVVHRPAEAELDLAAGEVLYDGPGVRQGTGKAVELGDDQGVARPAGGQRFAKTGRSRFVPVRPRST